MEIEVNRMRLGKYDFSIDKASFRYITQSSSGPGWDFSFSGTCLNDDEDDKVFPYGFRLLTEAAPLPLDKAEDYTGKKLVLTSPYDQESGEPLFGLNVWEEYDVLSLQLHFVERKGNQYRIEITATVDEAVFGHPERLELSAWTEELPDGSYPV